MSWDRFSYICRKTSKVLDDDEPVSECVARVENEKACQFYGDAINKSNLTRRVLDQVGSMTDRAQAKKALSIYSQLDITQYFSEPMQLKRVTTYRKPVVAKELIA